MVIAQGEVSRADLGEPAGSEPGFGHPVAGVQGDAFNRSTLRTVVCVGLTGNLRWAMRRATCSCPPAPPG